MSEKFEQQKKEGLQPRPPVVVVLGHVDHGKTSLLSTIRHLQFTNEKPGGVITQHIGAYQIEKDGKKITFIDTPGHEAFSAMRSRGAKVADIAVLVVAAEEGVKPQTKEAISHIKKAGILIIVAINKIDKPDADPGKVKRELAQNDVLVESIGGKIPSVETSAKTEKGINELLELILLMAEMEDLKGDIQKTGEGVIIESYLDSQRGPTATLILRDGILKQGEIVGTATTFCKIKILEDFQKKPQMQALPSMPCVVTGFEKVPQVGEKFGVYPDIESAQKYIEKKEEKTRAGEVFFVEEGKKVLNLILKADVQGSSETIEQVLKNLPQEKVILRILKSGVGEVNESDVKLAKASRAKILGFRVKTDPSARVLTERDNIKIMTFEIIYELAQAVRQLMEKIVGLEKIRVNLGRIKVLGIFLTEKNRQIIGGKVEEGEVKKGSHVEIFRSEKSAGKGKIINVQKNKKDVEKAIKREECGILYEGDVKIEEGDLLIIYAEERQKSEF